MDIFEWVFSSKKEEAHLPQVESLKGSLGDEDKLFDGLWEAYRKKRRFIEIAERGKIHILKRVPSLNKRIIKIFGEIIEMDHILDVFVRKILFEATERLHQVEGRVWTYGRTHGQLIDPNGNLSGSRGRRTPYNIENAKLAIWSIVKDEKELGQFVNSMRNKLQVDFRKLAKIFANLKINLEKQNNQIKHGIWWEKFEEFSREEQEIFAEIKRIISDITNKIIIFARNVSRIEVDEQDIQKNLEGSKTHNGQRVGVVLIHAITANSKDMDEYAQHFRDAGFVTYNVRLPGHGYSLEEFFNTPIKEVEGFLISAFKYFYSYMKRLNGGDKGSGRFYVAGVSLGAMMTFHIMAKRHQGNFIYQSMVKGFISISACLFPMAVVETRFRILEPIITGFIGPRVFRRIAIKKGGLIHNDSGEISEVLDEIKARGIGTNSADFKPILKEKLRPVIIAKMRETKKRFITTGELRMYPEEAQEDIIDLVIDRITHNIQAGLPPLNQTDIQDIKKRAERQTLSGHSRKSIADLGVLMYKLRKEVRHISIPVLVIQGMHDTISHPKSAHYLKKHIGDKVPNRAKPELILLQRSGHIPVMDFDRYEVFEKSIRFIRKTEKQYVKLITSQKSEVRAA